MTEQLNSERNAFLIEKRESHVLVGRILLLGFFLLGSGHLLRRRGLGGWRHSTAAAVKANSLS